MSRYIDADEMLEYLDLMYEHQDDKDEPYNIGVLGAINYIKHKAPSIDIVRCAECKYAHMTYGGDCKHCDMWKDDDDFCLELYLDGDFYCAYGERREP